MTICSHVCAVTLIGIGNRVQEIGVALNFAALSNRIFVMDWQVCYSTASTVYYNHRCGTHAHIRILYSTASIYCI